MVATFPTPRTVTLPSFTGLSALAAANFDGPGLRDTFFAGRRSGGSADYGVVTGFTYQGAPLLTSFSDAPLGVRAAAIGDFDSNGRADVALLHDQKLQVRLSTTGILDTAIAARAVGAIAEQIVAGDFNEDGKPDLAIGRTDGIEIALGDGAGNFAPQPLLVGPWPEALRSWQLATGDIDGDGHLDLSYLYTTGVGLRHWVVVYGDGQGGFSRFTRGDTGFRVADSTLTDLTGDGRADLITVQGNQVQTPGTSPKHCSVSIFPGGPNGFLPQQVVEVGAVSGAALQVLDVNSDGKKDIVLSVLSNTSVFSTVYKLLQFRRQ